MELLFLVFLFGLVSSNCENENHNLMMERTAECNWTHNTKCTKCVVRIIDSISNEPNCLSAGGICTVSADCPRGNLAERGLCPQQAKKGVDCCYGISMKETRCQKRGGTCLDKKSTNCKDLIAREATDCKEGSICCIMVT